METISDQDRYPILSAEGRSMLDFLREHPHAPIFRNRSGHRLTQEDLRQVVAFERTIRTAEVGWKPGTAPPWLKGFVQRCLKDIPFYRRYGSAPDHFEDLPTIGRDDLGRDIAPFVPDSVAVDRLINFRTSGTTGHPLLIASHPVVAANYLAFHKRALQRFGIELRNRRGTVGVVLVGYQRRCFTYVSVTPAMDESGLAKINLHPADWRDPGDRARYLDALNPEVYTGDPLSFEILADLPLKTKPRALLSTSMTLSGGVARRLESRFNCPVLDLYSLNEAGPVAVADPAVGGHVLLQPRLYVEIIDDAGRLQTPGARGEVTLTGGFNFCLPLLRYRTGDYAALRHTAREPVLVDLEGRPPVWFRTQGGKWINNIEVTHALKTFPIPRFALHQGGDGALRLRLDGMQAYQADIIAALKTLFGQGQSLRIEPFSDDKDKVIQYTSDLEKDPA